MRRPMLRLLFSLILILSSCAWVAQVTSAQPAAPIGQIVDVTQFGAAGDAKQVTDGVAATNSTMLTSATASFTAADVGKTIYVRGAGSTGADFQTTIAAVTHSTTITMTLAASTSVNSAVVIWGTD